MCIGGLPNIVVRITTFLGCLCLASLTYATTQSTKSNDVDALRVGPFELPIYSDLLSEETREGLKRTNAPYRTSATPCDPKKGKSGAEIRACEALIFPPVIAEARKRYAVRIEPKIIGGVYTEIITPIGGVPEDKQRRVLINLHGGAFMYGARYQGQLESMPIAAIGKYRVVSIDYRMAPEHHYPAASVDVAAVYRELLKEYDASEIGIYGCSAGGRITGQAVAWLAQQGLPRPGAVAILCSPPTRVGGDSNIIVAALQGTKPLERRFDEGYFKGVQPDDPLAFPGDSDGMLIKFPPVLLMTSTRDYSLSPMVRMHARLVGLGVPTELHIYEGLWHGEFLYNHYIPEAGQAAHTISRFFDSHLSGKSSELEVSHP